VDWGKAKQCSEETKAWREADDKAEDEAEAMYNEKDNYRAILTLLKPKESVARALRRLGGGMKTTAQKLKEKKRQKEGKEMPEEQGGHGTVDRTCRHVHGVGQGTGE